MGKFWKKLTRDEGGRPPLYGDMERQDVSVGLPKSLVTWLDKNYPDEPRSRVMARWLIAEAEGRGYEPPEVMRG